MLTMRMIPLLQGRTRGPLPRRRSARPRLEVLEGRALLSVLTVTDSSDDPADHGSLRYAIDHAGSGSTIDFAPKLKGGPTITLVHGALPIANDLDIEGPG